jgi:hypothetical protein
MNKFILILISITFIDCMHICNFGTWRHCICYSENNLNLIARYPDISDCRDFIADKYINAIQLKLFATESLEKLNRNIAKFFNDYCLEYKDKCGSIELPIEEERAVILEIKVTRDMKIQITFVVTLSSGTHTLRKEYLLSSNAIVMAIVNNFPEFKSTVGATKLSEIRKRNISSTLYIDQSEETNNRTTNTLMSTKNYSTNNGKRVNYYSIEKLILLYFIFYYV